MLTRKINIFDLIPQRPPIVMVDRLTAVGEHDAETEFLVREDNLFVSNSCLQAPGLIEHIAQSAAAFAGYRTFIEGKAPQMGFIGEIKQCSILDCPGVGNVLHTHIQEMAQAANITLFCGEIFLNGESICTCTMKICIKNDD